MRSALKYLSAALGVLIVLCTLYIYRTVQLGRGSAQPVQVDNLNPRGEMAGPQGIAFDPQGNLYVGDAQGIIWRFESGGHPVVYAQLDVLQPPSGLQAAGMAFDNRGNLYVATDAFADGSILQVDPERNVRFFARGLGIAGGLVLSADMTHIWVSDCRGDGRVLRYPTGGTGPKQPDLEVRGLHYPRGLAFAERDSALFAAERYSGNIVRIDLAGGTPPPAPVINIKRAFSKGSLGGLAFDPRDQAKRFLYVAENLRGVFTVVDVQSSPARIVKQLSASLMGGRPCPASMVIRDGYLYFTDVWACSPIRLMLGQPTWHRHAYRFRLLDLSSIFG